MKATFIYLDGRTEEFELGEDGISISVADTNSNIYFYIGGFEYREGVEEIVIK